MNSQELFFKDGKSAGVFYCEKCHIVSTSKSGADDCCKPNLCEVCGKEVERKHYIICDACKEKREAEKEAARFASAEIIQSNGPCFNGDNFYMAVSDMDDDLIADYPRYVYAAKEVPFVKLSAEEIVERISDDAYDDFDTDSLFGVEELSDAIEKFNAANISHVAYWPDYTKVILIDKPEDAHL